MGRASLCETASWFWDNLTCEQEVLKIEGSCEAVPQDHINYSSTNRPWWVLFIRQFQRNWFLHVRQSLWLEAPRTNS